MIELMKPKDEIELAMVKGILDGEGIPYVVMNDHFGSLLGGPLRYNYNEKAVMVDEGDLERASEVLGSILDEFQDG